LNTFGTIIGGAAVQVKLSGIAWAGNDLLSYLKYPSLRTADYFLLYDLYASKSIKRYIIK